MDEYFYSNTVNPFLYTKQYKSKIVLGNIEIRNTKHFNRFQKIMFKICFGIIVTDIKEEKNV